MLLQDLKSQEEVCVVKYRQYSQQAQDMGLKQLFNALATEEQRHFDTVSKMLQGQEPNMQAQQQQGAPPQQPDKGTGGAGDKMLCSDLLSTEKYVSGTYDTAIFESVNPAVRQALRHIQQDEQRHGEMLFNYMNTHGMYNVL